MVLETLPHQILIGRIQWALRRDHPAVDHDDQQDEIVKVVARRYAHEEPPAAIALGAAA